MKLKLYLDTSVFSAYYDSKIRVRLDETREFWKKLKEYEKYISTLVIDELNIVENKKLRENLKGLAKGFTILEITDECDKLADKYIGQGIFPKKYKSDALHLAVATVYGVDIFVSWNFKHLIKRKTRLEANLVNSLNGYRTLELISPPEL